MRWDGIHIAAVGSWLPEPVPAERAVREGGYDAERCATLGYVSALVADDVAPPDMAVRAARSALERSGVAPAEFSLLLHGSLWFQGLDIWPTASYVAARTVGRTVPAMDVQQRCNVGLGAIEMAAAHLTAGVRPGTAAMVTTADRWAGPAVDRWNLHDSNVYGDGGTALVLSRAGGFARLLSTVTAADNSLEGATRGDEPFRTASPAATEPIDLIGRARAHRAEQSAAGADPTALVFRFARTMIAAKTAALADAGLSTGDLARVVVPATGRNPGDHQLHDVLDVPEQLTTWDFGRRTGHVGGGDWAAGLEHLVTTGAVAAGDRVLLFGGGAGYTCTAAVLEITDVPSW
ncbi:secondary metabolite biosynthesis protein [Streptomyces sp. BG9H]|uniref:Secondary metabolite biosynthesis protein n=1 Tax=Streptomyces anatolicus TaxID=2675858 RepID=A0ABS6YUP3_9ACTN|nr:ketoacyl-ACP synthase III family protein [Streptomyces anatolicus]MBW5425165.1 secondary metabolite biosynthesis protein [Streptomyces anatolicus]